MSAKTKNNVRVLYLQKWGTANEAMLLRAGVGFVAKDGSAIMVKLDLFPALTFVLRRPVKPQDAEEP